MFIDTHCHLDAEYFPNGLDTLIKTAADRNVRRMLYVGCDLLTSENSVFQSEKYEEIYSAVGLHPENVIAESSELPKGLKELADYSKVVAIGEIGIDYYYSYETACRQKEVFAEQVEWAKDVNKPVVVHVRDAKNKSDGDAMKDVLEILTSHSAENCGGIIHCFSGNYEEAKRALDLGFYISFSGIVTFKNAADIREIAKKIPIDRILCETDSPYLAPVPYRGKSNQPAYVAEVYNIMAELKKITLETFSNQIEKNCETLFRW